MIINHNVNVQMNALNFCNTHAYTTAGLCVSNICDHHYSVNGNKANCVIEVEFYFLQNFIRAIDVKLTLGEVGTSSRTECCSLVGSLLLTTFTSSLRSAALLVKHIWCPFVYTMNKVKYGNLL